MTIAELLAPTAQGHTRSVEDKAKLYADLFVHDGLFSVRPITRSILVATALLRRDFPHKLADAIHVATAMAAGCSFFVSNDVGLRRLPSNLTRLAADAAGVGLILSVLDARR